MVLQHGPFSLHTMLEGPWLHKTAFPTPMVRPLDESQGSSPLYGHGSWLMCEVALSVTNSSCLAHILIVNCGIVSPTPNVNPTLFVVSREFLGDYRFIVLQLLSLIKWFFNPNFNHPWFHNKLLTREGRVLGNGWTRLSSMTIFVHLFMRSVNRKVTILTLNTITLENVIIKEGFQHIF